MPLSVLDGKTVIFNFLQWSYKEGIFISFIIQRLVLGVQRS